MFCMKMFRLVLVIALLLSSSATYPQSSFSKSNFAIGLTTGYNNGMGFQGNLLLKNFAEEFPFNIKLSFGVSFMDPGKSAEARKIFINDATNGTPEKRGKLLDLRADFLYNFTGRTYFYAGPRYAMSTGNFNYIGGNEDFDVTSNQWGAGVGVDNYFRISQALDLIFSFGYDYFFISTLYGHDTSYSPDGEDVNGREDFTFQDADDAINQPKHNVKAMIGLSYNL